MISQNAVQSLKKYNQINVSPLPRNIENQLAVAAYTYTWWLHTEGEAVLGEFKTNLAYRVVNSKLVWNGARTTLKNGE